MLNSEQPFKSALPWENISKALNLVGTARCNSYLMEKANVIYNFQLVYFWAFCPIRMGVLPNGGEDAHFAPLLNFAFLDYNEKRYKVAMRYVWKGN